MANHRGEYADISGEVLYAGITAQEMAKRYRGEVVFNHEGDPTKTFTARILINFKTTYTSQL
jgi:hypothetical protein